MRTEKAIMQPANVNLKSVNRSRFLLSALLPVGLIGSMLVGAAYLQPPVEIKRIQNGAN